jgi:L-type amino acid transporter 9
LSYWLYCVVGIAVLGGSVAYWILWQKVAPAIGKYKLVPEQEALADGTRVTVYKRVRFA